MGACVLSPRSPYCLRPRSAARLFLLCSSTNPRNPPPIFKTPTNPPLFLPPLRLHFRPPTLVPSNLSSLSSHKRFFCSGTTSAFSSADPKTESAGTPPTMASEKVGKFRKRLRIVDIKGGPDEGLDRVGRELLVRGWVRTSRKQSSITFIEVTDGSCLSNLQCVMSSDAEGYEQVDSGLITTGTSLCVEGILVRSQGSKQKVELKLSKLTIVGQCDPTTFPIQKKRAGREFLRTIAHLRPRTNLFGAVARVRNALAYATHKYFQENGFVWISSPIITASDCEGAGEQFCVTTLIPSSREVGNSPVSTIPKTKEGVIDWSQGGVIMQSNFGCDLFTVAGSEPGQAWNCWLDVIGSLSNPPLIWSRVSQENQQLDGSR